MGGAGAGETSRARVVFMGTPEYAVPSLRLLLDTARVVAVFTQPDRPSGRGRALRLSAVKALARAAGVPVHQPSSLRADASAVGVLQDLRPDLVVVAAYGLLLPPAALRVPRHGCLNVHASLLPRWRGASPVHHAIAAGDARTGSTILLLDEGLDSGPILAQEALSVGPHETCGQLTARLAVLGAGLLIRTMPAWLAGAVPPLAQDERLATAAPRLTAGDGLIDWTLAAERLARHVRAMNPWPGARAVLPDGRRLKVHAATAWSRSASGAAGNGPSAAPPGTVLAGDGRPAVVCGEGVLLLDEVQLEGRRAVAGDAFLRGMPGLAGTRLGAAEPMGPRPAASRPDRARVGR